MTFKTNDKVKAYYGVFTVAKTINNGKHVILNNEKGNASGWEHSSKLTLIDEETYVKETKLDNWI